MQSRVSKNMPADRRVRELGTVLKDIDGLQESFESLANARAQELLQDHRRVREASDSHGKYQVTPQLPIDVMGVYVLVPDVALF